MSSLGNLGNTAIGGSILGGLKATGSTIGEILGNIAGPEGLGLTDLVSGAAGMARNAGGWVAGKAGGLAQEARRHSGLVERV